MPAQFSSVKPSFGPTVPAPISPNQQFTLQQKAAASQPTPAEQAAKASLVKREEPQNFSPAPKEQLQAAKQNFTPANPNFQSVTGQVLNVPAPGGGSSGPVASTLPSGPSPQELQARASLINRGIPQSPQPSQPTVQEVAARASLVDRGVSRGPLSRSPTIEENNNFVRAMQVRANQAANFNAAVQAGVTGEFQKVREENMVRATQKQALEGRAKAISEEAKSATTPEARGVVARKFSILQGDIARFNARGEQLQGKIDLLGGVSEASVRQANATMGSAFFQAEAVNKQSKERIGKTAALGTLSESQLQSREFSPVKNFLKDLSASTTGGKILGEKLTGGNILGKGAGDAIGFIAGGPYAGFMLIKRTAEKGGEFVSGKIIGTKEYIPKIPGINAPYRDVSGKMVSGPIRESVIGSLILGSKEGVISKSTIGSGAGLAPEIALLSESVTTKGIQLGAESAIGAGRILRVAGRETSMGARAGERLIKVGQDILAPGSRIEGSNLFFEKIVAKTPKETIFEVQAKKNSSIQTKDFFGNPVAKEIEVAVRGQSKVSPLTDVKQVSQVGQSVIEKAGGSRILVDLERGSAGEVAAVRFEGTAGVIKRPLVERFVEKVSGAKLEPSFLPSRGIEVNSLSQEISRSIRRINPSELERLRSLSLVEVKSSTVIPTRGDVVGGLEVSGRTESFSLTGKNSYSSLSDFGGKATPLNKTDVFVQQTETGGIMKNLRTGVKSEFSSTTSGVSGKNMRKKVLEDLGDFGLATVKEPGRIVRGKPQKLLSEKNVIGKALAEAAKGGAVGRIEFFGAQAPARSALDKALDKAAVNAKLSSEFGRVGKAGGVSSLFSQTLRGRSGQTIQVYSEETVAPTKTQEIFRQSVEGAKVRNVSVSRETNFGLQQQKFRDIFKQSFPSEVNAPAAGLRLGVLPGMGELAGAKSLVGGGQRYIELPAQGQIGRPRMFEIPQMGKLILPRMRGAEQFRPLSVESPRLKMGSSLTEITGGSDLPDFGVPGGFPPLVPPPVGGDLGGGLSKSGSYPSSGAIGKGQRRILLRSSIIRTAVLGESDISVRANKKILKIFGAGDELTGESSSFPSLEEALGNRKLRKAFGLR